MSSPKTKRAPRSAAIEILPSHLRLVVVQPGENGNLATQTASLAWRVESTALATDEGRLELAAALRQLAIHFRLTNTPIHVTLSGDYCVTRVINGLNDEVRHELAELEQRSSLYLSLGHGSKAAASCISPIDARHQRAMLAVVNERVLNAITDALERANLRAAVIEPALVSLCRLVGQLGADQEHPAIIVHANEEGVEVGISHGGQLLLDYRPAAREAREHTGAIIGSHLHRLRRYCDRYVHLTGSKLETVFVSGELGLVDTIQQGLRAVGGLDVRPLAAASIDPHWQLSDPGSAQQFAPALGASLLGTMAGDRRLYPNLLARSRRQARRALGPALAQSLWPAAAVILIAAASWGVVAWKQTLVGELVAQSEELLPQLTAARRLRQGILSDQQDIAQLRRIKTALDAPAWNDLAVRISQCLPEDVWLDDVRMDAQGRLQLAGASFTEDGVFEFVRWLERFPELEHVALSGTRPTRLTIGPATQFDVRCDFNAANGRKELNDGNG